MLLFRSLARHGAIACFFFALGASQPQPTWASFQWHSPDLGTNHLCSWCACGENCPHRFRLGSSAQQDRLPYGEHISSSRGPDEQFFSHLTSSGDGVTEWRTLQESCGITGDNAPGAMAGFPTDMDVNAAVAGWMSDPIFPPTFQETSQECTDNIPRFFEENRPLEAVQPLETDDKRYFVRCRDFIYQSGEEIELRGLYSTLISIMSLVNQRYNVQNTPGNGNLCGLFGLEISLNGIQCHATFDLLLETLTGSQMHRLAWERHPEDQFGLEQQALMDQFLGRDNSTGDPRNLQAETLATILELLSETLVGPKWLRLGVIAKAGVSDEARVSVYNVYTVNTKAGETVDVWLFNSRSEGNVREMEHWSGIGPDFPRNSIPISGAAAVVDIGNPSNVSGPDLYQLADTRVLQFDSDNYGFPRTLRAEESAASTIGLATSTSMALRSPEQALGLSPGQRGSMKPVAKSQKQRSIKKPQIDRGKLAGNYQCDVCAMSFPTAGKRKHHERNHILSKNRPLQCEICDFGCFDRKDLDRHFRSKKHCDRTSQPHQMRHFCHHEGCPYVGTDRLDNLERHLRLVHEHN